MDARRVKHNMVSRISGDTEMSGRTKTAKKCAFVEGYEDADKADDNR